MKHTLYFHTIEQAQWAESALYHNAIECLSHHVQFLDGEPVLQFHTSRMLGTLTCSMLEHEAMPLMSSFNEAPDGVNTQGVVYFHSLDAFLDFQKAKEAQAFIQQTCEGACHVVLTDNLHTSVVTFITHQWLTVAQQKALKMASQVGAAAFNHILTTDASN
jgi:hypothetical protein